VKFFFSVNADVVVNSFVCIRSGKLVQLVHAFLQNLKLEALTIKLTTENTWRGIADVIGERENWIPTLTVGVWIKFE